MLKQMSKNNQIIAAILALFIIAGGVSWIRAHHLSSGIKLQCDIPETPETLAKLVLIKETYDGGEAYLFAKRFAGFTWHSGGASSTDRHELFCGLYNLTFYGSGMSHFEFNMPSKERYKTEHLSETQCIEKANQQINEIRDYFNSSLEYRVSKVEQIYPYTGTNGINSLNNRYYRIHYDIYYEGIELLGKGTDAWVEVCDNEILGYHLHFPVLEERGVDEVYLTPIDALNRLETGSVVKEVKFGYYTDFVYSDYGSVVEYGYLVKGNLDGELLIQFVSAMAGNAYR